MSADTQFAPTTCLVRMGDGQPCGRPIHPAPQRVDDESACIMHSHDPNKNRAQFQQEIGAILESTSPHHRPEDSFDFTRFVFPKADFSVVTFQRRAMFTEAEFIGVANFFRANFSEAVSFFSVRFRGRAEFLQVDFGDHTDFLKAQFSTVADFRHTTFGGYASFSEARFGQLAAFEQARFGVAPSFSSAEFSGEADFRGARFSQGASFDNAKFRGPADFRATGFAKEADFEEARFGAADFSWAWFARGAQFRAARFDQETRFVEAVFEGVKAFRYTSTLTSEAFRGVATFCEAVFGGKTYFVANRFAGPVDFSRAQFADAALFSSRPLARAVGMAVFTPIKEAEETREQAASSVPPQQPVPVTVDELCFHDVLLERPERVRFEDFDLRRTSFGGTNVRQVRFHNVQWPRQGDRLATYDELRNPSAEHGTLRLLYRDLKANLEEARDYSDAGDFYYAEMEIVRQHHPSWLWRWLLALFRGVAGYAERPLQTFLVLAFLILVSTWVLLLPWATFTGQLNGKPVAGWHLTSSEAFIHSIRAVFLRPPFFQPESKLAHLVTLAANIAGPIQIALLVLALRRRLRR